MEKAELTTHDQKEVKMKHDKTEHILPRGKTLEKERWAIITKLD